MSDVTRHPTPEYCYVDRLGRTVAETVGTVYKESWIRPYGWPAPHDPNYFLGWNKILRGFDRMLNLLNDEPTTRRAYFDIWEAGDDYQACFTAFHFMIRRCWSWDCGNILEMVVFMRSSDRARWEADLKFFKYVAEWVATYVHQKNNIVHIVLTVFKSSDHEEVPAEGVEP